MPAAFKFFTRLGSQVRKKCYKRSFKWMNQKLLNLYFSFLCHLYKFEIWEKKLKSHNFLQETVSISLSYSQNPGQPFSIFNFVWPVIYLYLNFNRYLVICNPLGTVQYGKMRRRARMMVAISWCISLLLSSPQAFMFRLSQNMMAFGQAWLSNINV